MYTEKDFPILTTQMKNINTFGLSLRAYRAIIFTYLSTKNNTMNNWPNKKSPIITNSNDLMSILTTTQPKDITNQHNIGIKTLKEIHTWINKQLSP